MSAAETQARAKRRAAGEPEVGEGQPERRSGERGHRTQELLLDAGVAVAAQEGLAGLSVNRVVAEAGVAKGTFYVHFADREAFVDALHARFHARVDRAVAKATAGTPAGAQRIWRGAEAYLDVCLADRAIKALALEARTDAALTASMSERHERFAASAVPSIRAMGWPDARAAAQLLAAMTSEIAIRELEAGRRLAPARRSLRRFLGVSEVTQAKTGKRASTEPRSAAETKR